MNQMIVGDVQTGEPSTVSTHKAWRLDDLTVKDHPLRHGHLVVSGFDGVHLGHQELLRRAADNAAGHGGPVVAVLFDVTADAARRRLTGMDETVRLLSEAGAEVVVLDLDLNSLDPAGLCGLLQERLAPTSIVVSASFGYGLDDGWRAGELVGEARSHAIETEVVPAQVLPGRFGTLSATAIRSYLAAGNIQAANALLGRFWATEGRVVHGHKRGRELGFPTANVELADVDLAYAIYAVRVHLGERVLKGVASYGTRPQFDNGPPILEVHILDFSEQIYGQRIRVEFVAHQRAEIAFASVDELTSQMNVDRENARRLLEAAG